MGRIEDLAERYERHIAAPWQRNLAGAQKAIFVVYPKEDERKLRAKRREFEVRTKEAGHNWRAFDLTTLFPEWMAADEYRDAYFDCPDDLDMKLESEFIDYAADRLRDVLTGRNVEEASSLLHSPSEHNKSQDGSSTVDEDTVVGVFGAAALYGFARVSRILKKVEADVRGRLVLFFPGDHDQNNYRLLDARDGWNYLAVPITLHGQ